jgi:hypothetical protein
MWPRSLRYVICKPSKKFEREKGKAAIENTWLYNEAIGLEKHKDTDVLVTM